MSYTIEYFNSRVQADIEAWPVDILADYARLVGLLIEHGPNLQMPYSRSMGRGLFELRAKGKEGIGRAFYCFIAGRRIVVLHAMVKKTDQTPERDLDLARRRVEAVRR